MPAAMAVAWAMRSPRPTRGGGGADALRIERGRRVEGVARPREERAQGRDDDVRRQELAEAWVAGSHVGAQQRGGAPGEGGEGRPHDGGRVLLPAQLVHHRHGLEHLRGEAAGGEGAPRVRGGAIQEDVHRGELLVPRVELGERAQNDDVAMQLAPRGLERLLRLARLLRGVLEEGGALEVRRALLDGSFAAARISFCRSSALAAFPLR